MKADGYTVNFVKQLKNNAMHNIIKDVLEGSN